MRRASPSSTHRILPSLLFLLAPAITAPALAHHSFSMYDSTKTVTLRGTVKTFDWVNPHITIWMYADGSGTPPQLWGIQLSSPGNMRHVGWTSHSLQPGDKVVIEMTPQRDGGHGGSLRKLTTASGVVLRGAALTSNP